MKKNLFLVEKTLFILKVLKKNPKLIFSWNTWNYLYFKSILKPITKEELESKYKI